ncbi:hypothetical protein StoSoilB5_11750 [Arthrobacter sp. StoSoilB5]|nr:hypothetical protein StoSoilB5_11750 [Arthrobacter sp. StoSoilB5]
MGTNKSGELTSRSTFRQTYQMKVWNDAEPGPTGGRLCTSCGAEVKVAPGSGAKRDWDMSHNPSRTNRGFESPFSRQYIIDNYNSDVILECIACNRSGGNNDLRFR